MDDNKRALNATKPKNNSFAISLSETYRTPSANGAGTPYQRTVHSKFCRLCKKPHDLDDCKDFNKKSIEDKRSFIMENSLCFACYGTNHRSKLCMNKRTCKTCHKSHLTALHIEGFKAEQKYTASVQTKEPEQGNEKVNNERVEVIQSSSRSQGETK
jgi:hypothetical protein